MTGEEQLDFKRMARAEIVKHPLQGSRMLQLERLCRLFQREEREVCFAGAEQNSARHRA